jgi:sugar phosphate isomerase/epimerase
MFVMNRSNLAAQLYTVRQFTQNERDLRESFRKIREIGYTAVQVSAIGPIEPERVKAAADEFGLSICATHVGFDRLQNEFEQVVAMHQLWNCDYVGVGSMPPAYRGSAEGFAAFAKEAGAIAQRLKERGLQFIYHNHKFEFERFGSGRTGIRMLLEDTDPDAFGFELDLYWVQAGGADPGEWIRNVRGRMDVVHLKDMAIVQDQQATAEIGEGNMNYGPLIEACRDIGVKWYVVEQDDCRRDPFDSLAISYRNLQKYIG